MPIEIKDLEGGLGGLISGKGVVTEEEFVDALKKYLTQDKEKFKKYRYSLTDWTAVSKVLVSTRAIRLIAGYSRKAAVINKDMVAATVANQDFIYGLSRMAHSLREDASWENRVFRNRQDAEAWIRERVKEKYGDDDLKFQ